MIRATVRVHFFQIRPCHVERQKNHNLSATGLLGGNQCCRPPYFEAIESQRGIAWRCQDSLSLRTFLKFALNEATPDHFRLSKIGDRLPLDVYEAVFAFVLKRGDEHGLLKGKTVGVDSTLRKTDGDARFMKMKDGSTHLAPHSLRKTAAENAIGKLILLTGDPGLGKSFVTVDMAARVSTGEGWPDCYDQSQPVGSVILFNCEDDIADTVLPQLNCAGGDPSKVIALQGVSTIDNTTGEGRQRGFSLDADLPKLIDVLEVNRDVRLVMIDPVSAYCGATDSHKNAEVRAMLAPLSDMASKYRVAVIMVTHHAKGSGGKAVYRAIGSLAFAAASRAVWQVEKDLDDDNRRLILMAKINIGEEATGLAYRLKDGAVCWEETPVVMTADEYLAQEDRTERHPRSGNKGEQSIAVQQATEWLAKKLTGCSVQAKIVRQMADDEDISLSTLKRAKKLVKVKSKRIGFGDKSVCWWTLPESELADMDTAEAARLFP